MHSTYHNEINDQEKLIVQSRFSSEEYLYMVLTCYSTIFNISIKGQFESDIYTKSQSEYYKQMIKSNEKNL